MSRARVTVIGGGAGGMVAAGHAAELGANVLLLEKMNALGKKILVSGKSRCNVTNTRGLDDFIAMFGPNGRFLRGAFSRFFRDELIELLKRHGCKTKAERGGRVFPASDDAANVVAALNRYMENHGVEVRTRTGVRSIEVEGGRVVAVQTAGKRIAADAVILATGGASWPSTGSTGDGYEFARALGHAIVPLRPALVPMAVKEAGLARSMQGVSLRNVRLTAWRCPAHRIDPARAPSHDTGRGIGGKRTRPPVIESRLGEMIMAHFGIGGPIVLQMSLAIVDALAEGPVSVSVDLKPALDEPSLRRRLQRDFDRHGLRTYRHLLEGLLPRKMIEPFVQLTGIPADKPGNQITAEERDRAVGLLKSLRFNISKPLPLSSAIVTAGGVSLKEIDPRTMSSRLVGGLFFCGEVMDLDADTGGYNLQAAFSTGYVAGESATAFVKSSG